MRANRLVSMFAGMTVLLAGITIFSNPKPPPPPPLSIVLSEVQVIDSAIWTVEFVYPDSGMPLSPDSVTNKFYLVYPGVSSSYRPLVKIKNGYGLITPGQYMQYPNIKFHPGDTVRLRHDPDTVDTWECVIDKRIKPTQSMSAFIWTCAWGPNPSYSYIEWLMDATPTIGYVNNAAGTYGAIKIYLCNKDSNPIANYSLVDICPVTPQCDVYFKDCFFSTDSAGCLYIPNLVSTQRIGSFTVGSDYVGPFSAMPGCTTTFVCTVNDYTGVRSCNLELQKGPLKILSVSGQLRSSLIVFTGNNNAEYYDVSVLSVNGKRFFHQRIASSGGGTYTVAWNGSRATKAPSGLYIARISTQNNSVERMFLLK